MVWIGMMLLLEDYIQFWCPAFQKYANKLERTKNYYKIGQWGDWGGGTLQFNLFTLFKKMGDLIRTWKYPTQGKNVNNWLFNPANKGTARSNGCKLTLDKFRVEKWCSFLTMYVINYWSKLPGLAVDSVTPAVFKSRVDVFSKSYALVQTINSGKHYCLCYMASQSKWMQQSILIYESGSIFKRSVSI